MDNRRARRHVPCREIPTVIFTGTKKNPAFPGNPAEQDIKLELHADLAASLGRAEHILVPESRHYVHADVPDLVIAALERVVGRLRTR